MSNFDILNDLKWNGTQSEVANGVTCFVRSWHQQSPKAFQSVGHGTSSIGKQAVLHWKQAELRTNLRTQKQMWQL